MRTLTIILLLVTGLIQSVYADEKRPAYVDNNRQQTLFPIKKPFMAPDFNLKGEDGKSYKLSDYRGQVVVLNFWTSWCPPCRYEFPAMERAWQKVKGKGVQFLAINMGEDEIAIWEFTGKYPVTFPLPMDRDGTVTKKYPVIGLPTTYVISAKGLVTHRAIGTREWEHPELLQKLYELKKK
jgi:peroxiredoxin